MAAGMADVVLLVANATNVGAPSPLPLFISFFFSMSRRIDRATLLTWTQTTSRHHTNTNTNHKPQTTNTGPAPDFVPGAAAGRRHPQRAEAPHPPAHQPGPLLHALRHAPLDRAAAGHQPGREVHVSPRASHAHGRTTTAITRHALTHVHTRKTPHLHDPYI